MYCDKDSEGRYALMDMDADELETVRRALLAYKTDLAKKGLPAGFKTAIEPREQHNRARLILAHIEALTK